MININRSSTAPSSLETEDIKNYLDELALFREDQLLPQEEQSLIKPICRDSWRNADLFEAFDLDFYAKCYLTEKKFETAWSMDVEHFIPRNQNPELTYTWTNLYPADHAANTMKPRRNPEGGYLDPCNPNDNVETEILYTIDYGGQRVHFEARNPENLKAVNTARLLDHIHNGTSNETQQSTRELRALIYKKYVEVLQWMNKWRVAREQDDAIAQFRAKAILKGLLSRKSHFTMLMRSIDTVENLPPDFFD